MIFPALSSYPISLLCWRQNSLGKVCLFSPITFLLFSLSLQSNIHLVKLLQATLQIWWSVLSSLHSELFVTFDTINHSLFLKHFLPSGFCTLYGFSFYSAGLLSSHSPLLVLFPRPLKAGPLIIGLISFPLTHTFLVFLILCL